MYTIKIPGYLQLPLISKDISSGIWWQFSNQSAIWTVSWIQSQGSTVSRKHSNCIKSALSLEKGCRAYLCSSRYCIRCWKLFLPRRACAMDRKEALSICTLLKGLLGSTNPYLHSNSVFPSSPKVLKISCPSPKGTAAMICKAMTLKRSLVLCLSNAFWSTCLSS